VKQNVKICLSYYYRSFAEVDRK